MADPAEAPQSTSGAGHDPGDHPGSDWWAAEDWAAADQVENDPAGSDPAEDDRRPDDAPAGPGAPMPPSGLPVPDQPASDQPGPDQPVSDQPGPVPPAIGQPAPTYGYGQPPAAPQPYPWPYQQPYQQPHQQGDPRWGAPAMMYPTAPPRAPRAKVPGWLWPLVAVGSLLLGVIGGAIAGGLVVGGGDGSGGVLKVERRTAPPLSADNDSIAAVAQKVLPSTVQISAEYGGKTAGATGSGWVFDKQGHIITNNHVVAQAAKDGGPIRVIDHRGRRLDASVVGRSPVYDVAVLRVEDGSKLEPMSIGSADQMRVGETVVAIGSPLGLSATVTSGIISAVNRPVSTGDGGDSSYINAVQTDAAINPGNSGGPLVNLQGEVVGVNSAIASMGSIGGEGGNIGVGFAIPIEQVLTTTDQILKTGKARFPVIGANIRGTQSRDGAQVVSVDEGAPAAKAGLRVGDVVTAIDGHPVTSSIELVVAIRTHVPGDTVTLAVTRAGKSIKVKVKLDSKVG